MSWSSVGIFGNDGLWSFICLSGMPCVLLTSKWRHRTKGCFAIWPQSSFLSCWTACWSRIALLRLSTLTTSREPYCGKQVGEAGLLLQAGWLFEHLTVALTVLMFKVSKESRSPTCWSRRPAVWHVGCAFCSACTQTRADRTPGRKSRDGCSSKEKTLLHLLNLYNHLRIGNTLEASPQPHELKTPSWDHVLKTVFLPALLF